MAISVEQIDAWRASRSEHDKLEFKEARKQINFARLAEYCVAMANEGGGHLVLGIADAAPREVVGSQAINNPTGMTEKLFQKLGFRADIEDVQHPDGRVVVVSIPSRPMGSAYHLDGRYLMRSGGDLVPMSEDRLRKIFAEGETSWGDVASRTGLTGQEVVDLLDTQTYFELMQRPFPTTSERVLEHLQLERLIDEAEGLFSIRRLGALLLARKLSDFPDVERKAPRVIVYSGSSKLETTLDQIGTKGYAVGFQGLIDFIMSHLPQNEVIENALRNQVKLVPEVVIRELVANALIHQDLAMSGVSVDIEVYKNRVEISNPGDPVVPVERFIDGYRSRNERLADLMRRMRICEEKSSGIDRVVNAAEVYQLPAPDFRAGHNRTSAVMFGVKPFEDMDRGERIRACYQHCALKWVVSESMTNQSLRERFKLAAGKSPIVSQIIAATIQAELIRPDEKVGSSRKHARYLPFWA